MIWYAAYIDDVEKARVPAAVFEKEDDAWQWAFDNALYHGDVVRVHITIQPEPVNDTITNPRR